MIRKVTLDDGTELTEEQIRRAEAQATGVMVDGIFLTIEDLRLASYKLSTLPTCGHLTVVRNKYDITRTGIVVCGAAQMCYRDGFNQKNPLKLTGPYTVIDSSSIGHTFNELSVLLKVWIPVTELEDVVKEKTK